MTISEVSKKYNLTHNTLRYYERIGLLPKVQRTEGGIRNYTENDCGWIEFIKCMRGAGIPVEVLVEYVTLFQKGEEETQEARKELLTEQYKQLCERIDEMLDVKEKLKMKIENISNLQEAEKELDTDNF